MFPGEPERVYPIAEIFGPTIEGEGDLVGAVCHFVRFAGCDSNCTWCDSGHAVLAEKVRKAQKLSSREILTKLSELAGRPSWVVFSGGNPLLHRNLDWLIDQLNYLQIQVNVETQATKWQPWINRVNLVTMSPKGPSSGNVLWPEDLAVFIHRVDVKKILKVVVFNEEDYEYAAGIHAAFPSIPFYLSVGTDAGGLQQSHAAEPIGRTAERFRWLAEKVALDPRFGDSRVLPQLHVFAWGHEQGH